MAVAEIVGALVGATSILTAGGLSARSQSEANDINLALYQQEREDRLKQEKVANQTTKETLALNKKQFEFGKQEAELNRAENKEQKTYDRLQRAADRYEQYLNNKNALTQSRLTPLMKR